MYFNLKKGFIAFFSHTKHEFSQELEENIYLFIVLVCNSEHIVEILVNHLG